MTGSEPPTGREAPTARQSSTATPSPTVTQSSTARQSSTGSQMEHMPARHGPLFWVSAAAGWLVIGWGLRGLFHHHIDTRPTNLARFVLGGALIHDLVVAPAVTLLGVAVARAVPAAIRAVVQGALIVSAILILFSWPLVRGYAHILNNPSSLPHNYTANLGAALACVWLVAAGLAARAWRQRARAVASTISDPKSTGAPAA